MKTVLKYLNPPEVRILPIEGGVHLRVEIGGDRCVLAAQLKRAFPLSHADKYISIQEPNDHEVGVLETLDGMEPGQRKLVLDHLERRYFTPTVSKIEDLRQDAGMWKFDVQTQRGAAEFYVRNWRDSAHEASPGRWQIHSVDGLRFEILDVRKLDERSQDLLEQLF